MKSKPGFKFLHFWRKLSRLHVNIDRAIGRSGAAIVHVACDGVGPGRQIGRLKLTEDPEPSSFRPLAFQEKDNGSLSGSLAVAVISTGSPTVTVHGPRSN